MASVICCTACGGAGRVTIQREPRLTQRCGHCKGRGSEPCAAPGCEFDAVTRVGGERLCTADAALKRGLMHSPVLL